MRPIGHALSLAAALLVGGTLVATAAHAQTPGYYVAVPAAPPAKARMLTRETSWTLRGDRYVAARAPERDAIVCELVVKNTGQLTAFTVGGKAFDDAQLARCNARARPGVGAPANVAAR